MPTDSDLLFGLPRDFVEHIGSNLGLSVVVILFLLLIVRPNIISMKKGWQKVSAHIDRMIAARRFQYVALNGQTPGSQALRIDRWTGATWTLTVSSEGQFRWIAVKDTNVMADVPSSRTGKQSADVN